MKKLDSFLRERFKELIKNLKEYEKSQDAEALHTIRVEVKKIKTILNLINSLEKGFPSHRHFIPLRNIFRKAGEIREPEVTMALLLHHQAMGIKVDLIPSVTEEKITAFVQETPGYIKLAKKSVKKIRPHLSGIAGRDITKIIKTKTKVVKAYLYPKPAFKMIHKVRKLVKEIVYLSEIRTELRKKERSFYDVLQDSIGMLHDKQLVLELIKKSADSSLRVQSQMIKKEILADKKMISLLVSKFY